MCAENRQEIYSVNPIKHRAAITVDGADGAHKSALFSEEDSHEDILHYDRH